MKDFIDGLNHMGGALFSLVLAFLVMTVFGIYVATVCFFVECFH